MEETKMEQISSTYMLIIGDCHIIAVINKDGRISLSHSINKYGHSKEFIFENSKAELLYRIGTLIRDAANLVPSFNILE